MISLINLFTNSKKYNYKCYFYTKSTVTFKTGLHQSVLKKNWVYIFNLCMKSNYNYFTLQLENKHLQNNMADYWEKVEDLFKHMYVKIEKIS